MGQPFVCVDAFADRPFEGNPAAVLLLTAPRDDGWLQAVARELNAPATAYLGPGDGARPLRWFSPTAELALCGHGTLAAAHVLFEADPGATTIELETRGGRLSARRDGGWIELDFPAVPASPVAPPPDLLPALGVAARYVGRGDLDYLVEVDSAEEVRGLAPDLARLREVETRGTIVTARSDDPAYDFVSRFFAPRVGIGEDAVTGSAHCCLGPFWAERLGRTDLVGRQLSPRGGTVRVRPEGARVKLAGKALTIARGELEL
jgi:predicted PhzF superfamily epimerase YddE/YHI9